MTKQRDDVSAGTRFRPIDHAAMSKVIIKSDHQRGEMNSVFRQVGGIIVTLQLSSFDLSLDIVLHDLFV